MGLHSFPKFSTEDFNPPQSIYLKTNKPTFHQIPMANKFTKQIATASLAHR